MKKRLLYLPLLFTLHGNMMAAADFQPHKMSKETQKKIAQELAADQKESKRKKEEYEKKFNELYAKLKLSLNEQFQECLATVATTAHHCLEYEARVKVLKSIQTERKLSKAIDRQQLYNKYKEKYGIDYKASLKNEKLTKKAFIKAAAFAQAQLELLSQSPEFQKMMEEQAHDHDHKKEKHHQPAPTMNDLRAQLHNKNQEQK